MSADAAIAGCILAGGQSRRMGTDKCWTKLAGTPLIERAIVRLKPQAKLLILNAHDDAPGLEAFGLPVVTDESADHQGPLGGILAAMRWAETNGMNWIATAAVDTPFFPTDLVERLQAAARNKMMAVASSGQRLHPVFGLWNTGLTAELEHQISEGLRSARQWVALHDAGIAEWPVEPYDPFFNINAPQDLDRAAQIIAEFRP